MPEVCVALWVDERVFGAISTGSEFFRGELEDRAAVSPSLDGLGVSHMPIAVQTLRHGLDHLCAPC